MSFDAPADPDRVGELRSTTAPADAARREEMTGAPLAGGPENPKKEVLSASFLAMIAETEKLFGDGKVSWADFLPADQVSASEKILSPIRVASARIRELLAQPGGLDTLLVPGNLAAACPRLDAYIRAAAVRSGMKIREDVILTVTPAQVINGAFWSVDENSVVNAIKGMTDGTVRRNHQLVDAVFNLLGEIPRPQEFAVRTPENVAAYYHACNFVLMIEEAAKQVQIAECRPALAVPDGEEKTIKTALAGVFNSSELNTRLGTIVVTITRKLVRSILEANLNAERFSILRIALTRSVLGNPGQIMSHFMRSRTEVVTETVPPATAKGRPTTRSRTVTRVYPPQIGVARMIATTKEKEMIKDVDQAFSNAKDQVELIRLGAACEWSISFIARFFRDLMQKMYQDAERVSSVINARKRQVRARLLGRVRAECKERGKPVPEKVEFSQEDWDHEAAEVLGDRRAMREAGEILSSVYADYCRKTAACAPADEEANASTAAAPSHDGAGAEERAVAPPALARSYARVASEVAKIPEVAPLPPHRETTDELLADPRLAASIARLRAETERKPRKLEHKPDAYLEEGIAAKSQECGNEMLYRIINRYILDVGSKEDPSRLHESIKGIIAHESKIPEEVRLHAMELVASYEEGGGVIRPDFEPWF